MNRISPAVLSARNVGEMVCENCSVTYHYDLVETHIRMPRPTVEALMGLRVENPVEGVIYLIDHHLIEGRKGRSYDCFVLAVLDDVSTSKIMNVIMKS